MTRQQIRQELVEHLARKAEMGEQMERLERRIAELRAAYSALEQVEKAAEPAGEA